jgi:hypothetical protein
VVLVTFGYLTWETDLEEFLAGGKQGCGNAKKGVQIFASIKNLSWCGGFQIKVLLGWPYSTTTHLEIPLLDARWKLEQIIAVRKCRVGIGASSQPSNWDYCWVYLRSTVGRWSADTPSCDTLSFNLFWMPVNKGGRGGGKGCNPLQKKTFWDSRITIG